MWALPDVDRIHAAVGRADKALKTSLGDGRGTDQLAAGITKYPFKAYIHS